MRSFRRLLLESFENELNEANRYFIGTVSENDSLDDEFLYILKDRYTFDDINDSFVGCFPEVLQRKSLLNIADTFFNEGYSYVTASDGTKLMYIPIFKFIFDNKSSDYDDFCNMYMVMHLTKDKLSAYENGLKQYGAAPFDFDIASKIDSVLNSKEYYVGINTIVEMLNYIDYENSVNDCDTNREYLDALNSITGKFHNYLAFWSTKEEIARYKETSKSSKKYSLTECYDNLSLVRFTLGKTPYTKNPVIQLDEIEELLQTGDEEQMKKNLITAFAYKEYDSKNPFFAAFSDVSLTVDDISRFIYGYEKTGRVLSADQFGNILANYRKCFLAREDEETLNLAVKTAYKKFRNTDYVSSDLDFIEQFALANDVSFTRVDFERIINGNYLYDFRNLRGTKSYNNYLKKTGFFTESDEKAFDRYTSEAQRREEIYNKYFAGLFLHQDSIDETMGYFIRKNVKEEDLEDFNKMKTWFEGTDQFTGWNMSDEVKARCGIKLLEEFKEELENSLFIEREAISSKYLKYALNDGVRKFAAPRDFKRILESYEIRFKRENAWAVLGEVCVADENKEGLTDRILSLGLTVDDVLEMFSILKEKADPEFRSIIDTVSFKLVEDEKVREQESERIKTIEQEKMYKDVVRDFLSTDGLTVKTYCQLNGTNTAKMQIAVNYCKENDPELAQAYADRMKLIRARYGNEKIQVETVQKIAEGIASGVLKEDETRREYNYLDYRLATKLPIGMFALEVLNCPENYDKETIEKVKEFTLANAKPVRYREGSILNVKEEISVNGVPTEISEDAKRAAFSYIEALELPKELKLYKLVVRGIVDGSLKPLSSSDGQNAKVFEK